METNCLSLDVRVCFHFVKSNHVRTQVMAYALHIERPHSELTLDEWVAAVKRQNELKLLAEEKLEMQNPRTREVVAISTGPGDVAVLFQSKGFLGFGRTKEWHTCIQFSKGKATFSATPDIELPTNPLRVAVSKLAKELNAKIVGDEGEIYEW